MKVLIFFCFQLTFFAFSQNLNDYYQLIDSTRIRKHVSVLANDSLEGRKTGEPGQKKAADYIRNEFRKLGLDSLSTNYSQNFNIYQNRREGTLVFDGKTLNFPEDFGYFAVYDSIQLESIGTSIISYESFLKKDYSTESTTLLVWLDSYKTISKADLENCSLKNIFFICKKYDAKVFSKGKGEIYSLLEKVKQNVFYIDAKKVKMLLARKNKYYDLKLSILNKNFKNTENVIAYIEGSDHLLKKEFVVISAHYDHLGIIKGEIYNGADDNASGTASLLELARVFQESKKQGKNPKRSLLFISFTGEEMGLFGSSYYTSNPLIPLKNTVADFNIDMIGHKDPKKEKDTFSVYVIGSDKISLDFHQKHETVAKKHNKLKLDYTYNDSRNKEQLYYRSDHYNFAKNGIPIVFYFGGLHEDYHKATDDIEKLSFSKIKTIAELVFLTAWDSAN